MSNLRASYPALRLTVVESGEDADANVTGWMLRCEEARVGTMEPGGEWIQWEPLHWPISVMLPPGNLGPVRSRAANEGPHEGSYNHGGGPYYILGPSPG